MRGDLSWIAMPTAWRISIFYGRTSNSMGWVDRLLLDVESRASGRHSTPCWRLGIGPQACTWALCDLLERGSSVERPRLAGSLLFLPVGSGAFVGSVALHGVESGAGRLGERGGSVEVVQRGSALRSGSGERDIR